jgi:hypothetical protein
MSATSI